MCKIVFFNLLLIFKLNSNLTKTQSTVFFAQGSAKLILNALKPWKVKGWVMYDRLMLRKRAVIESVNDKLKNICQIEHTRHRRFTNFITNLITGLLAYSCLPKKPSSRVDLVDDKQLMLF
ncbi:hypothetical protein EZS27_035047 [termite gut metagenome]|uniref:Transposase DDE domain-containing protein n=1 Tax=termite gut metagenome TaxID=433724 RepID=A0A5J4PYY1_9ZZZZ